MFLFLAVENSHLDNGHTLGAHLFVQQQVIVSKGKLSPVWHYWKKQVSWVAKRIKYTLNHMYLLIICK